MKQNENKRVDDVMALYLHGQNNISKYPSCPDILLANNELKTFFKQQKWQQYTLENGLKEISQDAVEFINSNMINRPRNVR